jgi:signal transduction histidine kinase
MTYHFELDSYIELFIAGAGVITALFLWKYKRTPGVIYLILLELVVAVWAISYAFEFGTQILEQKVFWSQVSYLGIAFLPVFYFLFATGFSQKNHLVNKRNFFLLSILPLVVLFLVFTNDYHHLIWLDVVMDAEKNIAHYYHGQVFWIFYIYTGILIFGGLYNLISSVRKFPSYYKSQIIILIIATATPVLGNLMYVTKINPYPGFDWTPLAVVVNGLVVAYGIRQFRMFKLVPVARDKLIDIINDCIVVVDSQGMIKDYNKAAGKLIGNAGISFTKQPFHAVFRNFYELPDSFDPQKEKRIEVTIPGRNKTTFDVIIIPVSNQYKTNSGHLLIFHDISELKKAQDSLQRSNKKLLTEIEKKEKLIEDLDAFSHTVAHDLKNPLSTIISSIDLFTDSLEKKDLKLLKELIGMMQISAEHSIHIIDELLILAHVRKQDVQTSLLDMQSIFSEALYRVNDMVKERNARVKYPENWPESIGYGAWIREVWFNYLSNAIKYGGNPPEIEVGYDNLNGNIRFWIKDNGDGIKPEDQPLLFNQFTRLNSNHEKGYGLGLSIVKRIIDKLNGKVGVESQGLRGEGSLFFFTLPKPQPLTSP